VTWLEVAQFVAADLTNRQIAGQLMLALEIVSAHIPTKLDAAQRSRHCARHGLSAATPAARQPTAVSRRGASDAFD
jgi:FixJ family two-component response regulator